MAEKKNMPAIRFKGFGEEWDERKIAEFGEIVTGSTPATDDKSNYNGDFLFVSPADIQNNRYIESTITKLSEKGFNKGRVLKEGSILFVSIGSTIGKVAQINKKATTNQQINAIVPNVNYDKDYIFSLLVNKARQIKELAATQAVPIINKTCFSNVDVKTTLNKKEQTQIGSYFQNLDKLISLHQAKINKLVNLKKAMLEKMFPKPGANVPEIRFKGFEGAWGEKPLSEAFANIPNNTLSRAQLNYDFGLAKNVHYGDVLIKFGELLDAGNEEIPFITDDELAKKYKATQLQNGDLIIADAAEDQTVGKCCEIINIDNQIIVAGLHTIAIRPLQAFAPKFLGYFMNSISYQNQIFRLMQGTKVLSISKSAIKNTSILYPVESEEQEKIGSYFQNLDKLITLHQSELNKLNHLKKACLEKMFF